jgi:DNA-binding Xre family transcriptional regulator
VRLFVKEIAQERGFSMSRLQREARLPMPTMQRYWSGKGQEGKPLDSVKLMHLDSICKTLGCSVADILRNVDEEEST